MEPSPHDTVTLGLEAAGRGLDPGLSGTLAQAVGINSAAGGVQASLERVGLRSGGAIMAASVAVPAAASIWDHRSDFATGNSTLVALATANVARNAAQGLAAGYVGAEVGTVVGGPAGTLVGFGAATGGWYALDKISDWTGLNDYLDAHMAPERIREGLRRFGSEFPADPNSGYTPDASRDGITLEVQEEDPGYFDPEKGIETNGKKYSRGQLMAFYLDSIPEERRSEIMGLGIQQIIVPTTSELTPELFETVVEAAEDFKRTHRDCRDLVVDVRSSQFAPAHARYGGAVTGGRITYNITISAFRFSRFETLGEGGVGYQYMMQGTEPVRESYKCQYDAPHGLIRCNKET